MSSTTLTKRSVQRCNALPTTLDPSQANREVVKASEAMILCSSGPRSDGDRLTLPQRTVLPLLLAGPNLPSGLKATEEAYKLRSEMN